MPRAPAALSAIRKTRLETIASATLAVETSGEGFSEITRDITGFLTEIDARDGVVLLHLRHTSASLVIQENADPDVQTDLVTALKRIAPDNAGWIHDSEGPDDMPAHIRAALTLTQLSIPVEHGRLALGTWQGVYLFEHRAMSHCRSLALHLLGAGAEEQARA